MRNRFSPIDPATVGMISLVEIPDKEVLIGQRMADVKALWTEYDPPFGAAYDVEHLEFDPAKITMEAGTAQQIATLSRINYMGKATSLLYAAGEDLDVVGSRYPGGVPRLNKGLVNQEQDDRYRYRLWLSANAYSTAGAPLAYIFHALTAVPELRDVTVVVERPSLIEGPTIVVTCMAEKLWRVGAELRYSAKRPIDATGAVGTLVSDSPTPTNPQLIAVLTRLQDESIGPPSDVLSVRAPIVTETPYSIGLWMLPNADHDQALATVRSAIDDLIEEQYYLGFDQTRMKIDQRVAQIGVQNAVITAPAVDVPIEETGVAHVGTPTISILGTRQ